MHIKLLNNASLQFWIIIKSNKLNWINMFMNHVNFHNKKTCFYFSRNCVRSKQCPIYFTCCLDKFNISKYHISNESFVFHHFRLKTDHYHTIYKVGSKPQTSSTNNCHWLKKVNGHGLKKSIWTFKELNYVFSSVIFNEEGWQNVSIFLKACWKFQCKSLLWPTEYKCYLEILPAHLWNKSILMPVPGALIRLNNGTSHSKENKVLQWFLYSI